MNLLSDRIGVEIDANRSDPLESVIRKRMNACGIRSVSRYSELASSNNDEFGRLVDLVTNNLSKFFRNRAQLRSVAELVVPELTGGVAGRALKVWVIGCATGEEPYSVGMVLSEAAGGTMDFVITASDVSRGALETARRGLYAERQVADIPPELRSRYLTVQENGFRVANALRDRVDFMEHNVTMGPAVRDADMVLCRNVLIYLSGEARRKAMKSIRESLADGGFLLVGNSESLARESGFSSIVTEGGRVYRRPCPARGRTLP